MRKPSIFSRDYEKRMKRRKVKITMLISIVIIVFAFSAVLYMNDDLKKFVKTSFNIKQKFKNTNDSKDTDINRENKGNKEVINEKPENKSNKVKEDKEDVQSENGYSINLSSGIQIKAMYEIKENNKKFKYIAPVESTINYSINSSGKAIVIFDDKSQKIIFVDIDGNIKDITKNEYISTSGTVFTKEAQINAKPDYVWCSSPLFIGDEKIAYVSNLPWFNKTSKYIWIFDVKNNSHNQIQEIFGDNIKLSKNNENTILANVDGKNYVIDSNGTINAQ